MFFGIQEDRKKVYIFLFFPGTAPACALSDGGFGLTGQGLLVIMNKKPVRRVPMHLMELHDFSAPELDVYARLTEAQLLNC